MHHTFTQRSIRRLYSLHWLFLLQCGVIVAITLTMTSSAGEPPAKLRMGAVSTVYYHNSHADIILSRILQTDMLDGTGRDFSLDLVSLYMDQRPANDISRLLAASHRFHSGMGIRDTLTLGTDALAVDGVLMIAEHGQYPYSSTGNQQLPKRRFWDEILKVFDESGRVVPVFIDKHLADNWKDAEYIYRSARERHIPLMAGSSVSGTWRFPPADVRCGAHVQQIVGISHGSTDAYGFHGLEAIQSLAEQRHGGESGVVAVQCLTDAAIWEFVDAGGLDNELLTAALDRLPDYEHGQPLDRSTPRDPKLMIVEYADGLKVFMLELNRPGRSGGWTAAWREGDSPDIQATQFWTQEARPAAHFGLLLDGIEKMMITGKPTWPVERTLLTSGVLDAVLQSRVSGGKRLQTPWLNVKYTSEWRWKEPSPPPACRPWGEQ